MTGASLLLALVTLGRLVELWFSRRNTRKLLARGAIEVAPGHYPAIVLLHVLWLGALWLFGMNQPLNPFWLAGFLGLQVARLWVLTTLGSRWTTRIIVVPGERLVATGPYRFVRHPNYVVVVGEIVVLPLCLGLPWLAVVFTLLNAALLMIRIRAENAALDMVRTQRPN
ncbi:isoprenylcysteine carboxyl methyltransferase family protein [Aquibaculum arenosum]|uniref:Isoprenylcysteine carboxylmethyltransferase family protein n=1 Tax=Aquibaculum arenosum TaxID=3032591 RepID=A0ABT5YHV6_9PROT|nr:isoprenylcysteine carboxylmethyltransferase family protein [Fodinicurvata sp. CAU 1616]MDF2094515.1 isoprenylcysteine carboxylmethyltransferase family protein [Fodinicurvata sp. CAU 1616]